MESAITMFRSAWGTYKAHWQLLSGIAAVPAALFLVGSLLYSTATFPGALIGGVFTVAGLVSMVVMQAATIVAVGKIEAGETAVTWSGAYALGFGLFWPLVLAMIMQIAIGAGAAVLFLVPALVVGVYTSFYVFALVNDGKRGWSAFAESFSVVYTRWWSVLGRLILPALVYFVVAFIVAGLEFVVTGSPASGGQPGQGPVGAVGNAIASVILGPLFIIYLYRIYESLKRTRAASAPADPFKMWLMVFSAVGVLALIVFPAILLLLSMHAITPAP